MVQAQHPVASHAVCIRGPIERGERDPFVREQRLEPRIERISHRVERERNAVDAEHRKVEA
jgi:hypothetical protein